MSIISQTFGVAGQVGVTPRRVQMVVTDSLSVLTASGYLNEHSLQPNTVYPTDIFDVIYAYSSNSGIGTYGEFLPIISNGLITLSPYATPYIAGSWTPIVTFGGASTGITYSVQNGDYTRMGNIVFVSAEMQLTSVGSATGSLVITNLPVIQGSPVDSLNYMAITLQNATIHNNSVIGYVDSGGAGPDAVQVVYETSGSIFTAYTNSDLTNTTQILMSGFYFVS